MDSWGRPIQERISVDGNVGVPAVREGILHELRKLNTRNGNGIGVLQVLPRIICGSFAYSAETDVLFMSAMWSLVRDGIIVLGHPAGMALNNYATSEVLGFSLFTVTPYGRQYLERSDVVHPLEGDAYMRAARERLGKADEVIYTYLSSARKSFADANYLSAIVMLGVSTEVLMKWLIDCFIQHVPEKKRASFEKTRRELWNRTDKLFDTFIGAIQNHFASDGLSHDLHLQVNAYLDQMQTLIRVDRDDVGHGRPQRADAQLVSGSLEIYLPLVGIVRELVDELMQHECRLYSSG